MVIMLVISPEFFGIKLSTFLFLVAHFSDSLIILHLIITIGILEDAYITMLDWLCRRKSITTFFGTILHEKGFGLYGSQRTEGGRSGWRDK